MKLWLPILTLSLALLAGQAQAAKRFGGGKSFGQQSSNVTQRQATPAPTPSPAPGVANTANKAPAAAPAPAPAPRKPWGAMLGGLAAGLGLAWLASSLGLGEAMGQVLMFALVAMLVMMVIGWFMRSRGQRAAASAAPFAFQSPTPAGPAPLPSYRPENVGNDASARPWERSVTTNFEYSGSAPLGGS